MVGLLGLVTGTLKILLSKPFQTTPKKFFFLEWGWALYTLGVIFGAFWAKSLYDAFWVWDIKEILSLITVVIYLGAVAIDRDKYYRLRQLLAILGLLSAFITLIIPNLIVSYHFFV